MKPRTKGLICGGGQIVLFWAAAGCLLISAVYGLDFAYLAWASERESGRA